MRFLADENIPLVSIQLLRAAGHDVVSVSENAPGIPDRDVLAWAVRDKLILLTFDRDYGDLLFQQGLVAPHGLVYFRLNPTTPREAAERLLSLLNAGAVLEGHLTIVLRDYVRYRPLQRNP